MKYKTVRQEAPPMAPTPVLNPPPEPEVQNEAIPSGIKGFINYIANSSEFERLIYLIWKGQTHRGASKNLKISLTHEYKKRFGDVMNELKTNPSFMKRKEVSEK